MRVWYDGGADLEVRYEGILKVEAAEGEGEVEGTVRYVFNFEAASDFLL